MERENADVKKESQYELGIVTLLGLLISVLIFNRIAIVYLFPFIMSEFKIGYAQAGALSSIYSLGFFFTWFFGGLSDRVGRKIVLISASVVFSILSLVSGFQHSFLQMFLVRGLLGFSQAAVMPAIIATISVESKPTRRGFNFGLVLVLGSLISLGIGAIVVTQLTKIMPWRMVISVIGTPGLIISIILYLYMREPKLIDLGGKTKAEKSNFFAPLRYRNIIFSAIIYFLLIACFSVFMTFAILYLTKEVHLSMSEAGIIISLFGFAAAGGSIILPLLSDHVGRKPTIILSLFATGLCFLGIRLCGSHFFLLATLFAIVGFTITGIAPIIASVLPTESVPSRLAATASGITISAGDGFSAMLIPFLAGYLSDLYGLRVVIWVSAIAPIIAGSIAFLLEETAPKVIGKKTRVEVR